MPNIREGVVRPRSGGASAFKTLLLAALVSAAVLLAVPAVSFAATFTVNTTADNAPSSTECSGAAGDCSLRQAIDASNHTATDDTIIVPAGDYKLTIAGSGEDADMTGDLDVNKASGTMTIAGAGARSTTIDATGLGDRVLQVVAGTLDMSGFTITGGVAPTNGGGGILNSGGTLSLSDSTITANQAPGSAGGGVSSPTAAAGTAPTLTLSDDTFTNNAAGNYGGAVDIDDGIALIVNTTMTGNSGPNDGGAVDIDTSGTVQFTNDTIDGNQAPTGNGGGVWASGSNVQFVNTIVANNASASASNADCYQQGAITDQGHNLDSSGTCFTPSSSNGDINGNPKLGPLQNNGGQTDTQALLDGSPAINAGENSACPATDQRGVSRPQPAGGVCDIGAYEATPPATTTNAASNLKMTSATLNGSVNPENLSTTYYFEYGTTTSYGHKTATSSAGSGNSAENVSAALSGLKPGTRYHFRLVATNSVGTSMGVDRTFKTKARPYAGAYAPHQTDSVSSSGTTHVRVVCPKGTYGSCTGTLVLRHNGKKIGQAHVHIRPGRSARATIHLTSAGRNLVKKTGHLRVSANVSSHDAAGTHRLRTSTITLTGRRASVSFTG